jgi:hypothetical protein
MFFFIYAPFQDFYKYETDFSEGAWELFMRRLDYIVEWRMYGSTKWKYILVLLGRASVVKLLPLV